MRTQPSPKTIVCRDCGYELTIHTHGKDEILVHFCEQCGSQNIDIKDNNRFTGQHPVQFIKNLLQTKIF